MHWRFIHHKTDALNGRVTRYLHRHPTIEVQAGLYEALKPIARKRGYRNVNDMIASETQTMLMNILLQEED